MATPAATGEPEIKSESDCSQSSHRRSRQATPKTTSLTQINTLEPNPTPQSRHVEPAASAVTGSGIPARRVYRSDAPTPSVNLVSDDGGEPQLMEIRERPISRPSSHLDDPFTNSFRDIGVKLKACNDTLGELQQLGVTHVISLPKLVLVGDQSAGKSSLMSGLADIELPRSEGQCTRCPVHISLSRNAQWSCHVKLQRGWEHSPDPVMSGPITSAMVTDANRFPPWQKRQQSDTVDFKTVTEKGRIDHVLRWAQIAVLNDSQDFKTFIPDSGAVAKALTIEQAAAQTETKFSPNVVSLVISGPDLPDLSFYDMPGIFKTAENAEDQYLVEVVKYLMKEYVRDPDAIIMCALPMNQDAENSASLGILRNLRAEPRTIGVLTKADLLPRNSTNETWLKMLRGRAYQLGHGYFITSRPTDQGLDELRQWEENYFDPSRSYDWPPSFHSFGDVCGVDKLKMFLSKKLGQEFANKLPFIKAKVIQKLDQVNAWIRELPELPDNYVFEVHRSLNEFQHLAKDVLHEVDLLKKPFRKVQERENQGGGGGGGGGHDDTSAPLSDEFLKCLILMKPTFILKHPQDKRVIEIIDSDDESTTNSATTTTPTPTPSKRARTGNPPADAQPKRSRPGGGPVLAVSTNGVKAEREGSVTPRKRPRGQAGVGPRSLSAIFGPIPSLRKRVKTLDQLRHFIANHNGTGHSSLLNPKVHKLLCTEAVEDWDVPAKTFLEEAFRRFRDAMMHSLRTSMATLKTRLIFKESASYLTKWIEQRQADTLARLSWLHNLEKKNGLFTINEDARRTYERQERETLLAYRHHMRWNAFCDQETKFFNPAELKESERAQYESQRRQQEGQMKADPFEQELEVATYVRGYYLLAAHRFGDTAALLVRSSMLPDVAEELHGYLFKKLGLSSGGSHGAYIRLMSEDELTALERQRLKTEKERFEKALRSIEALEAQPGGGAGGESDAEEGTVTDERPEMDMSDGEM